MCTCLCVYICVYVCLFMCVLCVVYMCGVLCTCIWTCLFYRLHQVLSVPRLQQCSGHSPWPGHYGPCDGGSGASPGGWGCSGGSPHSCRGQGSTVDRILSHQLGWQDCNRVHPGLCVGDSLRHLPPAPNLQECKSVCVYVCGHV